MEVILFSPLCCFIQKHGKYSISYFLVFYTKMYTIQQDDGCFIAGFWLLFSIKFKDILLIVLLKYFHSCWLTLCKIKHGRHTLARVASLLKITVLQILFPVFYRCKQKHGGRYPFTSFCIVLYNENMLKKMLDPFVSLHECYSIFHFAWLYTIKHLDIYSVDCLWHCIQYNTLEDYFSPFVSFQSKETWDIMLLVLSSCIK